MLKTGKNYVHVHCGRKRMMHGDDKARVPFAFVAVTLLLLAGLSAAFLSSVNRDFVLSKIENQENERMDVSAESVQAEITAHAYSLALENVRAATQFSPNDESYINALFSNGVDGSFDEYIERSFPRLVSENTVDVTGYVARVVFKEKEAFDLEAMTETNSEASKALGTATTIKTTGGRVFDDTSTMAYYTVEGQVNITITKRDTGYSYTKTFPFDKEMKCPYPFLDSKFRALTTNSAGDTTEIARMVKYILTTVAQYRVLKGYGMEKIDGVPLNPTVSGISSNYEKGTSQILTTSDMELAVNLAMQLEISRLYRTYDEAALAAIDTNYGTGAQTGGSWQLTDGFDTDTGNWVKYSAAVLNTANSYVQLTPAATNQCGQLWLNREIKSDFTVEFSYKAGGGTSGSDGTSSPRGADGIVLMFYKNPTYSPAAGGNLGFITGSLATVPGYGIEFDNWYNSDKADPSGNHIALIKDNVNNHIWQTPSTTVEDNQWHTAKAEVTASSIRLSIDGSLIINWAGVVDRTYGGFGFSAATGGGTNNQFIDNVKITTSTSINAPQPPVRSMEGLVEQYATTGTIDAADLVALFFGDGQDKAHGLNLETTVAQSLNSTIDQFILKFLDHFGMMEMDDAMFLGIQFLRQYMSAVHLSANNFYGWLTNLTNDGVKTDGKNEKLTVVLRYLDTLFANANQDKYFLDVGTDLSGLDTTMDYPAFTYDIDISSITFRAWFVSIDMLTANMATCWDNWAIRRCESTEDGGVYCWWESQPPIRHDYIESRNSWKYRMDIKIKLHEDFPIYFPHQDITKRTEVWASGSNSFWTMKYQGKGNEIYTDLMAASKKVIENITKLIKNDLVSTFDPYRLMSINPNDNIAALEATQSQISLAMQKVTDYYSTPAGKLKIKDIISKSMAGDYTNTSVQNMAEELCIWLNKRYDELVNCDTTPVYSNYDSTHPKVIAAKDLATRLTDSLGDMTMSLTVTPNGPIKWEYIYDSSGSHRTGVTHTYPWKSATNYHFLYYGQIPKATLEPYAQKIINHRRTWDNTNPERDSPLSGTNPSYLASSNSHIEDVMVAIAPYIEQAYHDVKTYEINNLQNPTAPFKETSRSSIKATNWPNTGIYASGVPEGVVTRAIREIEDGGWEYSTTAGKMSYKKQILDLFIDGSLTSGPGNGYIPLSTNFLKTTCSDTIYSSKVSNAKFLTGMNLKTAANGQTFTPFDFRDNNTDNTPDVERVSVNQTPDWLSLNNMKIGQLQHDGMADQKVGLTNLYNYLKQQLPERNIEYVGNVTLSSVPQCTLLYMQGKSSFEFAPGERTNLKAFVNAGGTLFVEDMASMSGMVDIAFVQDTSGSVVPANNRIAEIIGQITTTLQGKGISLQTYTYKLHSPPIGLHEESWGTGTTWAANNCPWRDGATRIVFPISDECPYEGCCWTMSCNSNCGSCYPSSSNDVSSITTAINTCVAKNVVVYPIYTTMLYTYGYHDVGVLQAMDKLADGTGGEKFCFDNNNIADKLISIIEEEVEFRNSLLDEMHLIFGTYPTNLSYDHSIYTSPEHFNQIPPPTSWEAENVQGIEYAGRTAMIYSKNDYGSEWKKGYGASSTTNDAFRFGKNIALYAAPYGLWKAGIEQPFGRHYINVVKFTDRAYESQWNVTIVGKFRLDTTTQSEIFKVNGTHAAAWRNGTVDLNMTIPITVYSGWELNGINYALGYDFLKWFTTYMNQPNAWNIIQDCQNWMLDDVHKLADLFVEMDRKSMEDGGALANALAKSAETTNTVIQTKISGSAATQMHNSVVGLCTKMGVENLKLSANGELVVITKASNFALIDIYHFKGNQRTQIVVRPGEALVHLDITNRDLDVDVDLDPTSPYTSIYGVGMPSPCRITAQRGNDWKASFDCLLSDTTYYTKNSYTPEFQVVTSAGTMKLRVGVRLDIDASLTNTEKNQVTNNLWVPIVQDSLTKGFAIALAKHEPVSTQELIDSTVETLQNMWDRDLSGQLATALGASYSATTDLELYFEIRGGNGYDGVGSRVSIVIKQAPTTMPEVHKWLINNVGTFINGMVSDTSSYRNARPWTTHEAFVTLPEDAHENVFVKVATLDAAREPAVAANMAWVAENLDTNDWGTWRLDLSVKTDDSKWPLRGYIEEI